MSRVCVHDLIYRANGGKCFVRRGKCRMIQAEQDDRSVDEDTADSRDVGKFVAGKLN